MCGDAEFAVPGGDMPRMLINKVLPTSLTPQGGDIETMEIMEDGPTAPEATEEFVPCDPIDATSSIYFGESITSFRQMLKRYVLLTTIPKFDLTGAIVKWRHTDFPMSRGYATNAMYGTGFGVYNLSNTTLMNYLSYGFLMYRGGFRYKYVYGAISTGLASNMYAERDIGSSASTATTSTVVDITSDVILAQQCLTVRPVGWQGFHVTPGKIQPSLEVETPFYSNNRFHCARTDALLFPGGSRSNLSHTFSANMIGTGTIDVFVAGSEDLTFHLFQGCRPYYLSPTTLP